MATLALLDLISPYALGGAAFGEPLHEFLTALFVESAECACDPGAIVIRGVARFSANAKINPPRFTPPASISFGGSATVDHNTVRHDGAWWDFPDIAIEFRLVAARVSSPIADLVVNADATVGPFLASLGQGAGDAPDTAFQLDLLIDAATLHLPFLRGAKLLADGTLAVDPTRPDVKVTLPKIKLAVTQDSGVVSNEGPTNPVMSINFDSWAAHDIDDPSGSAFADVLRMDPPYAFFGPGDTLGFGFQTLILDLSSTFTPPELLAKFGVGDDFRGLYLPDVRVFVSGMSLLGGMSLDVSARELLIGLGPEGGVSGIFGVDLVNPAKPQGGVITIYDGGGRLLQRIELPDAPAPPAPVPVFKTTVSAPATSFWLVDVTGGQPPYNITIDQQTQTADPVTVTMPAGALAKTVAVAIADVHGGQSRNAEIELTLSAPSLTSGSPRPIDQPAALTVLTAGAPGYAITMIDSPRSEQVTLQFTPPNPVSASLSAGGATSTLVVTNGRATATLTHNAQIEITANWSAPAVAAAAPVTIDAYFQYAEPAAGQAPSETDAATHNWAAAPANLHHSPSLDEHKPALGWTNETDYLTSSAALSDWLGQFGAINPTPAVSLTGSASHEDQPNPQYNVALSTRRVWALESFLRDRGVTRFDPPVIVGEIGGNGAGRGRNRKVVAMFLAGGTPAKTIENAVRIARPARPAAPAPFKPDRPKMEPAGSPSIQFRELHLRVELDHNKLIAIEIKVKVDVKTVLESHLASVKADNAASLPPGGRGTTTLPIGKQADPNDGVIEVRIQITLDDTIGRWQVLASLFENDKDGFLQTPPPSSDHAGDESEQFWRTYFGVLIALAPLLDATASANTTPGDVTALAIGAGLPLLAAASGDFHVPRITIYGGELTVTHDPGGVRGALLLDVEVKLLVSLALGSIKLIDTKPDSPITIRYKAIGFTTSDKPKFRDLIPVFDSSKGYTIDIPSGGGITVPDPLGDILQVAGTRIARSNPVNLELDLEIKADLGVVSVDRTTIRIPLDGSAGPTLSALGVHLDVPGAIEGHGYLALFADGFAGQLDVSLPGLGVRVAAGLSVRHVVDENDAGRSATAIIVTLEVDFPVPILLGQSGLGIYGFGGLFALHFRRDEHEADPVPALAWLTRVHGNPLDISGWKPQIDNWAIGLGAVLGTVDSGFTLNVKGMLIFEMPGPRILLVMKATILFPRPPREGDATATILAVIDLDLGRHMITIGLTFDYEIKPLVQIHVPMRAIFPFDDITNFAIDVGPWWNPATVTFFDIFTARGYFMVRGKDIPNSKYDGTHVKFPLGQLSGFSIATGVSASYHWGDEGSGLYINVGSSIDIGMGFEPLLFRGEMRLWGELHLWVVGIEASARLSVTVGEVPDGNEPDGRPRTKSVSIIDGEVHGKVDLFFFDIEGSIHVTLGSEPGAAPQAPPPLVTAVTLHSRSAAFLTGSGVDRPIDGKLADARTNGAAITEADHIPIDSIVVIHFDCVPRVPPTATFDAQAGDAAKHVTIGPASSASAPKVRRGDPYYAYRLKGVTLSAPLSAGDTPIVWWTPDPGMSPLADESKIELALLSRVPSAHPSAVERSKHLEDSLDKAWSTVCDPVAPETAVLWTFEPAPNGASPAGWTLRGVAWPDNAGARRSKAPNLLLNVADPQSGAGPLNAIMPTNPARVIAGVVSCDPRCAPRNRAPLDAGATPTRADELLGVADLTALGVDVAKAVEDARAAATGMTADPVSILFRPPADFEAKMGLQSSDFRCVGKALEAPYRWPQTSDILRDHPLGDALLQLDKAALSAHPKGAARLDDVVAFSCGEVVRARFLLAVPDALMLSGQLILRAFDQTGAVVREWRIDGASDPSRKVAAARDLPKAWLDPDGPWFCPVVETLKFLAGLNGPRAKERGLSVVFVEVKLDPGVTFLQTGIVKLDALLRAGFARPSYFVGVVEMLSAAEVARRDADQSFSKHQVDVINGALQGMNTEAPALLLPQTDYEVAVAWEWAVCDENGHIADENAPGTWKDGAASFAFRTDDAPLKPRTVVAAAGENKAPASMTMPVRLDPWVLASDPDEGEKFYFWGEKLRVVIAVDYLLDMFQLYGAPLEARVRAASYRNADPGSPNHAMTVQALKPSSAKPLVGAAVFTPWEATMRAGLLRDAPCIETSGQISRHVKLDLDLLLEPRTDFVFDIDVVGKPPPAPGVAATPMFRRKFTTSRYRALDEMCAAAAAAKVNHVRPAPDADLDPLKALLTAPGALSAGQLDAALRAARLEPATPVDAPTVDIVWEAIAGVSQPNIVVLRTPEPLIRMRRTPVDVEPAGQPRLGRKISRLELRPFLEIVATPGVAGAAAIQAVGAPHIGIALVFPDSARGKVVDLSIRRHDDPFLDSSAGAIDVELLHLRLTSAPWETA